MDACVCMCHYVCIVIIIVAHVWIVWTIIIGIKHVLFCVKDLHHHIYCKAEENNIIINMETINQIATVQCLHTVH